MRAVRPPQLRTLACACLLALVATQLVTAAGGDVAVAATERVSTHAATPQEQVRSAPSGSGAPQVVKVCLEEGGGMWLVSDNNETSLYVPRSDEFTVTWALYEDYVATSIELTVTQVVAQTHYFGDTLRVGGAGTQMKPNSSGTARALMIEVPWSWMPEGSYCYLGRSDDPDVIGGTVASHLWNDSGSDLPGSIVAENLSAFDDWVTTSPSWKNQTYQRYSEQPAGTYYVGTNSSLLNHTADMLDVDWTTSVRYSLAGPDEATYSELTSLWGMGHYTIPFQAYGYRSEGGSRWSGTATEANLSYVAGGSHTYATGDTTTLSLTGISEQGDRTGGQSSLSVHTETNQSVRAWLSWRIVYAFSPHQEYSPDGGERELVPAHAQKSYPGPWVSTYEQTWLDTYGWYLFYAIVAALGATCAGYAKFRKSGNPRCAVILATLIMAAPALSWWVLSEAQPGVLEESISAQNAWVAERAQAVEDWRAQAAQDVQEGWSSWCAWWQDAWQAVVTLGRPGPVFSHLVVDYLTATVGIAVMAGVAAAAVLLAWRRWGRSASTVGLTWVVSMTVLQLANVGLLTQRVVGSSLGDLSAAVTYATAAAVATVPIVIGFKCTRCFSSYALLTATEFAVFLVWFAWLPLLDGWTWAIPRLESVSLVWRW